MKELDREDLLTLEEVRQILGVPREKIDQWIHLGMLNPIPINGEQRFYPEDIRALFEERQRESSQRRKRILVIDDDTLVGRSLKNFLEQAGFDATVVSIGLAALDFILNQEFDLLVVDIRMPGMNGIETLKAIRELRNRFRKPPLAEMILTGYDDEEVKEAAQEMGICDFILKPFEAKPFLAAIKRNLDQLQHQKPLGGYKKSGSVYAC